MNNEWRTERLGDVCDLIARGIAPAYVESGGVRVVNQKCVRDHTIDYTLARRHDTISKAVSAERFIRVGDVLVNSTGTGTLGRVAQVRGPLDESTTVDTHVTIVRPKHGLFYPEFFGYVMTTIETALTAAGEGASGQTELARSKLENDFEVRFPTSIAEQQRIVAILDEAFEGIRLAAVSARASLDSVDLARLTFESTALGASKQASWPVVQLGEIANFRNGLNYTKSSTGEIVAVVGVADFENNFSVDLHALNRVQIDGRLGAPDELAEGDILMVRSNGSKSLIGRTMLVGKVHERVGYSGFVIRTRLHSSEISPDYLCHYLKSSVVRAALVASGAGANISSLSQGALAQLTVPCLSKFEQASVVRRLEIGQSEFDALTQIYQRKLICLAELKQSLLALAFSGELIATTVPIANDNEFATPEQAANILAYMHWQHERASRGRFFGHVMGQKTMDLVERVGCVELGRSPYKDAAGPNDRAHMIEAERWAKQQGFFEFVQRSGGGYDFKKLSNHGVMLTVAKTALRPVQAQLARVTDILVGKDKVEAEVFDTVLAAWNNLVADGAETSDASIIYEARENWHPDKLAIPISKFHSAIQEIRRRSLVPDGTAKVVRHRQASLL